MFYVPEKISGLYCSDTLVYAVHDIINLGHNRFLPDLDDKVFFGKVVMPLADFALLRTNLVLVQGGVLCPVPFNKGQGYFNSEIRVLICRYINLRYLKEGHKRPPRRWPISILILTFKTSLNYL